MPKYVHKYPNDYTIFFIENFNPEIDSDNYNFLSLKIKAGCDYQSIYIIGDKTWINYVIKIFEFFNQIDEEYPDNYHIRANNTYLGSIQNIENWFIKNHNNLSEICWEYVLEGESELPEFWDGYCLDIDKLKMR